MPLPKPQVQAALDYGETIYQNAAATILKPLDAVNHSALRFITGDRFNTHHCILYHMVSWTALNSRRALHFSQSSAAQASKISHFYVKE